MLINRTTDDQIVIKISSNVDGFGLQRALNYLKYLETTAGSRATQADVDTLADEVNAAWWKKNKKQFIK